ncbi:hypothetical protein KGD83_00355 [Nocardiopsis akebiae]|uniref:Uncharacterized protein n=1 Tax=Nocardiopsis akebiae TaxID=2831968 RepID=A0ABX8C479_9ACTN|nr:hypothetical protein [Nocardiopsis akebiae]QUX29103.1 hypothetical protein KGD83_00355 [Nocardiopsis akebiae]
MRTIADNSPDHVRPVHLLSPFLGMVAMLSGGTSAYANGNYGFLAFCALLVFVALGVQVYVLLLLYRRRRHRAARPHEES